MNTGVLQDPNARFNEEQFIELVDETALVIPERTLTSWVERQELGEPSETPETRRAGMYKALRLVGIAKDTPLGWGIQSNPYVTYVHNAVLPC